MGGGDFKRDLLTYGGINSDEGTMTLKGKITILGNGSYINQLQVGNLSAGNIVAALPATANIDIRGNVVAPGNVTVSGQVNTVGNVVASFFIGNGSQLTGVTSTLPGTANLDILNGNVTGAFANVVTIIATSGNIGNIRVSGGNVAVSGQVNALGNVVAPFFIGNGSLLTGVSSTLPGTANLDILNGNITGAFANVSNVIATFGNVGNARFSGGNVAVSGQINALGNVVAPFFIGDGSLLTGIGSNWIAYTPTITAPTRYDPLAPWVDPTLPAPADYVFKCAYTVIGKTMVINFNLKLEAIGTAGYGIYCFSIPSGYTIDQSVYSYDLSLVLRNASTTGTGLTTDGYRSILYQSQVGTGVVRQGNTYSTDVLVSPVYNENKLCLFGNFLTIAGQDRISVRNAYVNSDFFFLAGDMPAVYKFNAVIKIL
jgi:hypothetical protein